MTNVLYVSIAFPPKSDAECLQSAKYFHYLQQHRELDIEVVTSTLPTLYMKFDPTLAEYAQGCRNLVSIPLRENRWVNLFRSRLGLGEATFPDSKQSFHQQSGIVLDRLSQRPDVIYSRSYPLSSTVLAYKLHQALGTPWVMHLSDPWAGSPLHGWSDRYLRRQGEMELRCMEAARYVCLTSMGTVDFYAGKYPHLKEKFLFFPNVFEHRTPQPGMPELDRILPAGKLKVVFTGAMASGRSPRYFLEPLQRLLAKQPLLRERIVVIFAGEADRRNRKVFRDYASLPVHYLGKIPFGAAQYLQQRADLLLLIDTPVADRDRAMYFPSKLIDYMSAGKRILAIAAPGSVAEVVMRDLSGSVANHDDIDRIADRIGDAIEAFASGSGGELPVLPEPPIEYEARHNADRLADLLKRVAGE
jgi:hypothetical protein